MSAREGGLDLDTEQPRTPQRATVPGHEEGGGQVPDGASNLGRSQGQPLSVRRLLQTERIEILETRDEQDWAGLIVKVPTMCQALFATW